MRAPVLEPYFRSNCPVNAPYLMKPKYVSKSRISKTRIASQSGKYLNVAETLQLLAWVLSPIAQRTVRLIQQTALTPRWLSPNSTTARMRWAPAYLLNDRVRPFFEEHDSVAARGHRSRRFECELSSTAHIALLRKPCHIAVMNTATWVSRLLQSDCACRRQSSSHTASARDSLEPPWL